MNIQEKKKLVVYTCLFGTRDILNEQDMAREGFADFICFTDNRNLKSESWKIKVVDQVYFEAQRESRRPKALPHLYLSHYDYSIYIDNTVKLNVPAEALIEELIVKNQLIKVFHHPLRNCPYDEAVEVLLCGMDDQSRVWEQVEYYKSNNYPPQNSLAAGCVILRKHNENLVKNFGDLWFEHILRFSRRDQLSFNFCAHAVGLNISYFDESLFDNSKVTYGNWKHELPSDFNEFEYSQIHNISEENAIIHYKTVGKKSGLKYRLTKTNELCTIFNKYRLDAGSLYGMRHSFCRIYNKYLKDFKNQKIVIFITDSQNRAESLERMNAVLSEFFIDGDINILNVNNIAAATIEKSLKISSHRTDPNIIINMGTCLFEEQLWRTVAMVERLLPDGLCFFERTLPRSRLFSESITWRLIDFLKLIISQRIFKKNIKDLYGLLRVIILCDFITYDSMNLDDEFEGKDCFLVIRKRKKPSLFKI